MVVDEQSRRTGLKTPIALAVASLFSMQLAHADQTASNAQSTSASADATTGADAPEEPRQLADVIVTATGRAQRAEDVPYNMSVLSEDDLKNADVTSLGDLSRQVAGLTFLDMGVRSNGVNNGLIIRGLNGASAGINDNSPAAGEMTVSTYINSTPVFSDLKITDVARVEVLRGPQGTLYGAGSVGGTVRFIFNKPDPTAFSGDVQTKVSQTEDSDELNYSVDGIVNIPLSRNAALRVSAGYEDIAGVIDAKNLMVYDSDGNPELADPSDYFGSAGVFKSKKDVDDADIRYARVSGLWDLSDSVSALLTYQHQENKASDFTGVSPYESGRVSTRYRTSPSDNTTDVYALELTADVGFATLTSSTSYSKNVLNSESDYTNFALEYQDYYAGFPRISDYTTIDYTTKRFVQELRLADQDGGDWDWVTGAYYSQDKQTAAIRTWIPGWSEFTNTPGDPIAVAALGEGATYAQYYQSFYPDGTFDSDETWLLDKKVKNPQTALYGELTRHLTPRWQVTGGARVFWVQNDRGAVQTFPAAGAAGDFTANTKSSSHDQIFKVNSSYEITSKDQVYFTWSQGYRQGGTNALPATGWYAADPSLMSYKSDFANNYEVGAKGRGWGNRLSYSAAAYYIAWRDIQVQIPAPVSGIPTLVNGGDAVSKGLELQASALLSDRWQATLGYSYTDAELTDDFYLGEGFVGYDGNHLPGVPVNSANGSLSYTQPLQLMGYSEVIYRVDGNYRSHTKTALNDESSNYAQLSGFATWNASVDWSNGAFRAGVFVHNITDEDGVTAVDYQDDTSPPSRPGSLRFIQRPRTVGISMGYSF